MAPRAAGCQATGASLQAGGCAGGELPEAAGHKAGSLEQARAGGPSGSQVLIALTPLEITAHQDWKPVMDVFPVGRVSLSRYACCWFLQTLICMCEMGSSTLSNRVSKIVQHDPETRGNLDAMAYGPGVGPGRFWHCSRYSVKAQALACQLGQPTLGKLCTAVPHEMSRTVECSLDPELFYFYFYL